MHRVAARLESALLELFQPDVFAARLAQAVRTTPHYELEYASSVSGAANAGNAYEALRVSNAAAAPPLFLGASASGGSSSGMKRFELQVALRALNSPYHRRITASANGVTETTTPASGDAHRETNVHPYQRYLSLWLALGFDQADAELRNALLLEFHPDRNSVGKEQLRSGHGGKACYVLRRPTVGVPMVCCPTKPPTVRAAKRFDAIALRTPASFVTLGCQLRQSRQAMRIRPASSRSDRGGGGAVLLTRPMRRDGTISLLGAPSNHPAFEGMAAETYKIGRDLQAARVMTDSARRIANAIDAHRNARNLPGLPVVPLTAHLLVAERCCVPLVVGANDDERFEQVQQRAWALWWERFLQQHASPDARPTDRQRALVRVVHEANTALNDFKDEWAMPEDAPHEHAYDVSRRGLYGRPEDLHRHLNAVHLASGETTHRVVQHLLSSFHIFRTPAVQFLTAFEASHPARFSSRFVVATHAHARARIESMRTRATTTTSATAAVSPIVDVPTALTRANVRDIPASLDAVVLGRQSASVATAMQQALRNADEAWCAREPSNPPRCCVLCASADTHTGGSSRRCGARRRRARRRGARSRAQSSSRSAPRGRGPSDG